MLEVPAVEGPILFLLTHVMILSAVARSSLPFLLAPQSPRLSSDDSRRDKHRACRLHSRSPTVSDNRFPRLRFAVSTWSIAWLSRSAL